MSVELGEGEDGEHNSAAVQVGVAGWVALVRVHELEADNRRLLALKRAPLHGAVLLDLEHRERLALPRARDEVEGPVGILEKLVVHSGLVVWCGFPIQRFTCVLRSNGLSYPPRPSRPRLEIMFVRRFLKVCSGPPVCEMMLPFAKFVTPACIAQPFIGSTSRGHLPAAKRTASFAGWSGFTKTAPSSGFQSISTSAQRLRWIFPGIRIGLCSEREKCVVTNVHVTHNCRVGLSGRACRVGFVGSGLSG